MNENNISIIVPSFIGTTHYPERMSNCESVKHTTVAHMIKTFSFFSDRFYINDKKQIDGSALFFKKKSDKDKCFPSSFINTECIELSSPEYKSYKCNTKDTKCSFYPDHNPIVSILNFDNYKMTMIVFSWNIEGCCNYTVENHYEREIKIEYIIDILNKLTIKYYDEVNKKYDKKQTIITIYCIQELILKSNLETKIKDNSNETIYDYTLKKMQNNFKESSINQDNFTGLIIYDIKEPHLSTTKLKEFTFEINNIQINTFEIKSLDIRPLSGLELIIKKNYEKRTKIESKIKIFNIHLIAIETIETNITSYNKYLRSNYHLIELIRLVKKIKLEEFINESESNNFVLLTGDHNDTQLPYLYSFLEIVLNSYNQFLKKEILSFWNNFELSKPIYNNFVEFYNALLKYDNLFKNKIIYKKKLIHNIKIKFDKLKYNNKNKLLVAINEFQSYFNDKSTNNAFYLIGEVKEMPNEIFKKYTKQNTKKYRKRSTKKKSIQLFKK
jgi:hypothetical protein